MEEEEKPGSFEEVDVVLDFLPRLDSLECVERADVWFFEANALSLQKSVYIHFVLKFESFIF